MLRVVGMISGTSADGIDAALVELDGQPPHLQVRLIQHITVEHPADLRAEILTCFRPESSGVDRLNRLNARLGEAFARAALDVIAAVGLKPEQVDLIGSHGQAMWYDPPQAGQHGAVLTLAEPAIIAERTGITTISHFREPDLAAGGFGAPLVSYLDWLLFRHPTRTRATQNIGGIGNVTALPALDSDTAPITFDTGPGNMLIDYCASRATHGAHEFDRDGLIAAQGHVHEDLLAGLMQTPYLRQPPPKTTGRELFGVQFGAPLWDQWTARGLSPADITATFTAFTAESIADAYRRWIPFPLQEVYVAGGGAKNPTLMRMLRERIGGQTAVYDHGELGVPGAAKESILFALLAYETWHRRVGALPVFTGAAGARILGRITHVLPSAR